MDGSRDMSSAISLPFAFDADGRVANTADQSKIIQDRIVLVLMTTLTERIMRPAFGSAVRNSSFENPSQASTIVQQAATIAFNNWLPYLTLLSTNASIDSDGFLNVDIKYKTGPSKSPQTVSVKTAILNRSGDVIVEVPNVK
jgi:phage baseplate assembly protein W